MRHDRLCGAIWSSRNCLLPPSNILHRSLPQEHIDASALTDAKMAEAEAELASASEREHEASTSLQKLRADLDEALLAGAEARDALAALVLKEVKPMRAAETKPGEAPGSGGLVEYKQTAQV